MHGLAEGTQVYFTHSYAAPVVDDTVAICDVRRAVQRRRGAR